MSHEEHNHDHCQCGCGCGHEDHEDEFEPIYINTVTEEGEELTFELLEVFEFEDKLYCRLGPCDDDADEDEDLVMECEIVADENEDEVEYMFHQIEDDALFERIVAYLDAQMVENEEGENA